MALQRFHSVCGRYVVVSAEGTEAHLIQDDASRVGVVFTAEPLRLDEQVCFRVTKTNAGLSSLTYGFTTENPNSIADAVRRNVWRPYLIKEFFVEGVNYNVFVKASGEVHYWCDGETFTYSFSEVDVSRLWLVVHVPARGGSVRLVRPNDITQPPLSLVSSHVHNLHPMSFHRVHGEGIHALRACKIERTTSSRNIYAGFAFSANSVRVNERVCLNISSNNINDVQIGFTDCDPATSASPGTTIINDEPIDTIMFRYWLEPLGDIPGRSIYFYLNSSGEVHVGADDTPERLLCTGVSTSAPVWVVVNITALGTSVRFTNAIDVDEIFSYSPLITRRPLSGRGTHETAVLSAPQRASQPALEGVRDRRLSFHPVHGKSVAVSGDVSAECTEPLDKFRDGLVFSARPIQLNEKFCIRTVAASGLHGKVEIGFTNYDPATLSSSNTNVVDVNLTDKSKCWTETLEERINFRFMYLYVNASGEVHLAAEGIHEYLFFSGVDTRAPLWILIKISGRNTKVTCSKTKKVLALVNPSNVATTVNQTRPQDHGSSPTTTPHQQDSSTCTICCEDPKNTVLISCGHVCACYECAIQLWQGQDNGQCPVCRAQIEGILRIYT